MATKKAKSKTTKKKSTPVNKRTTTRVVSAKTAAKSKKVAAKKSPAKNFIDFLLSPNTIRMVILELVGVFILSVTYVLTQGHPMYMMFAVAGVFLVLYSTTGGFFNPALTFGAWINRKISGMAAFVQMIAQFLGGMLGLITLENFIKATGEASEAAAMYGSGAELFTMQPVKEGKEWYLFVAELIGMLLISLFLARLIKSKSSQSRLETSLGMGLIVFTATLLTVTITSYASGISVLNPGIIMTLKTFPSDNWIWLSAIYIIAPLIGAVIGFFLGDLLEEKKTTVRKK